MRQKRFVQIVAVILALVLLLSIVLSVVGYVALAASSSQEEIDALKEEADTLEKKSTETESKINSMEFTQMSYIAKKEVLDEQVILIESEISNLNEQLVVYDELISDRETEVAAARKKEGLQLEKYKMRVRAMEENGKMSYLAVIFDAIDFLDLLTRLDFVHEVTQYNEDTYNNYLNAKQRTASAEESVDEARTDKVNTENKLNTKKSELVEKVENAQNYLIEVESSLESYEAYCGELDDAQIEVEKEIKEKTSEFERVNQQKILIGSGSFTWPVPSRNTVISAFGTRLNSDFNYYRTHYGVDISAEYGADIAASDKGTVTVSEYHSSYGNYIVVDHGNGYATVYAHLSSRLVFVGDEVSQGDIIGYAGSTGDATEPHLHFELRLNGTCVNPLTYLSDYTVSEQSH